MHGQDVILFEECEIEVGKGLVILLDAELTVDWWLSHGDLEWQRSDWRGVGGVDFDDVFLKWVKPQLETISLQPRNVDYIEGIIVDRNDLVISHPYSPLPSSAFL